jgi:hypothetical protein
MPRHLRAGGRSSGDAAHNTQAFKRFTTEAFIFAELLSGV